ncbi:hypothetical protein [Paenibacillus andongensis]|uniref:hypothetical protein n=1 Tax=Paenibacillus andongensis TaxID=2975482 RepID=UPI0021BB01C7|nr:hypothetical protein [Paenibacillus andongensis]
MKQKSARYELLRNPRFLNSVCEEAAAAEQAQIMRFRLTFGLPNMKLYGFYL